MVQRVASGAVAGIDGQPVTVEVDVRRGLPALQLVGLPAASLRESRERVTAAVRNCGLPWPSGRVTVNLLPADVRKDGAAAELAVAAAACLAAVGREPPPDRAAAVLLGELSLDGTVRPVRGLLAMVLAAAAVGKSRFLVPADQAGGAARVPGVTVHGVRSLVDAVRWLRGETALPPAPPLQATGGGAEVDAERDGWFSLVPPRARRLAEIAVAGRHHVLLVGPPGCGKTRLARWLGRLQPPLAGDEALEVARIHGAAGRLADGDWPVARPFRAPHHSVTRAGLLGGGARLAPGEVTLAHRGVLFLDELAEFPPAVLEGLREPLAEGQVAIARGAGSRRWPAAFQLVAAANPCRCGHAGSSRHACRCDAAGLARYRRRYSGPLLDRIDLFLEMEEPPRWSAARDRAATANEAELLAAVRRRVAAARALLARCRRRQTAPRAAPWADLPPGAAVLLEGAARRLALSRRGIARCAAVATTIAALAGRERPAPEDVVEALGYRREAVSLWAAEGDAQTPPADRGRRNAESA